MTVTMHQEEFPQNVVHGRNVTLNVVRLHIGDRQYHHVVFGEILQDPCPALFWTMENIEVLVRIQADGEALHCVKSDEE